MTEDEVTRIAYDLANRLEYVNQEYIELLCKQIKDISTVDEINLDYLYKVQDNNIKQINKSLKEQCAIISALTMILYTKYGSSVYDSTSKYYKAKNVIQPPFYRNWQMQAYLNRISRLTQNTFTNLSNTTVIDTNYRNAIDKAITTVRGGSNNYQSQLRKVVSDAAIEGTRVQYNSGYTRRLDSAARMNILSGTRQLNIGIKQIAGEQFGADGMEISAHALCAPDHVDIQGEQFSLSDYDKINSSLDRPIGELNCQHTASPIVLGVSEPTYSKEQLKEYEDYSNEKIDIDGKEVTRYEASQIMRNLETQARYQKDLILAGKSVNDPVLTKKSKDRLKRVKDKYKNVSKKSGLKMRPERMSVPSRTQPYSSKATKQYLKDVERGINGIRTGT